LSQIQTRGTAGGNDEFVEIYNATAAPVAFDSTWEVMERTAASTCAALSARFSGSGQMIPAHGHLLYANSAGYPDGGVTAADGAYSTGISDAAQVVLLHGGALVDSLCFYVDTTTQANLTCESPPATWFACQGTPVSNLPHDNTTSSASNSDVAMVRRPGGAAGNGQDTGDNAADWTSDVPSSPHDLASAPTP
jgi:hypothetical protein